MVVSVGSGKFGAMRCWMGGVPWIGAIIRNFNSRLGRIVDALLGMTFDFEQIGR